MSHEAVLAINLALLFDNTAIDEFGILGQLTKDYVSMQCLMASLPDPNLLNLQLIFVFYFALDHQNPMLQEEVPIDLEL